MEAIQEVQGLLEVGGGVLIMIFVVALALWTLILERIGYVWWVHPDRADQVAQRWDEMPDKDSWDAQAIRRLWISELTMDLDRGLALIRALVSVCPLLGLLGTTTGMVEVYETMAIAGNGEPRLMAAGVSQAMVTTMAGLVVALSGILFSARLEQHLVDEHDRLTTRLHVDEDLLGHHHRVRSEKARARTRAANERHRQRVESGPVAATDQGVEGGPVAATDQGVEGGPVAATDQGVEGGASRSSGITRGRSSKATTPARARSSA